MEFHDELKESDLEIEFTEAEKELEKILSIERDKVDVTNENRKLKQLLKRAKVQMWRKYSNLVAEREEHKKKAGDMGQEKGSIFKNGKLKIRFDIWDIIEQM